jgi:hypothetical protein
MFWRLAFASLVFFPAAILAAPSAVISKETTVAGVTMSMGGYTTDATTYVYLGVDTAKWVTNITESFYSLPSNPEQWCFSLVVSGRINERDLILPYSEKSEFRAGDLAMTEILNVSSGRSNNIVSSLLLAPATLHSGELSYYEEEADEDDPSVINFVVRAEMFGSFPNASYGSSFMVPEPNLFGGLSFIAAGFFLMRRKRI